MDLPSYKNHSAYMKAWRAKRKSQGIKTKMYRKKPKQVIEFGKYADWFSEFAFGCGTKTNPILSS